MANDYSLVFLRFGIEPQESIYPFKAVNLVYGEAGPVLVDPDNGDRDNPRQAAFLADLLTVDLGRYSLEGT
ncbi:hypothetical protein [Thermoactinospora rubra]|uniref:hypothetical protein n=1 Tax=Thermoactinospora rubra TaxID=1088767 RepID=UPI000A101991|nr:hypothetical protein [Thermoactinospora rubra]